MLLLIISITTHMRIRMQVIIEDYVHGEGNKLLLIMANTFLRDCGGRLPALRFAHAELQGLTRNGGATKHPIARAGYERPAPTPSRTIATMWWWGGGAGLRAVVGCSQAGLKPPASPKVFPTARIRYRRKAALPRARQ